MEGQCECRGEEKAHRDHMGGIVMEMQILIAGIRHPIEMAQDSVWKTVAPCAEKHGPYDDEREIREDRDAISEWDMIAHAEFARNFRLSQSP